MHSTNDVNNINKQTYDELADEYEGRVIKRTPGNLERVKYFSSFIKTGKRVLDVGCAVGLDILLFRNLGYEADGVELSPKMAAYAQKRNPKARIFIGDFLEADITEMYDAVFTRAFIHVFPKPVALDIMHKIYSLLVAEGVAFFGVSMADESQEGWLEKDDYKNTPKRYKKLWTEDELRESLVSVGFEIIDIIKPVDAEGKKRVAITVKKSLQKI
ncbi:MAG TPA: methyltransferase domain-containing protein [Candidatus Saccharimonadales bacterium]|nr:methyltransferase domain-containing protein [Candidatus Saccharimonadales bacterium]